MPSETTRPSYQALLPILALVLLAMVFRGAGITWEPLWNDELFTLRGSEGGIADILEENARDIHPPLYYLGLSPWRQAFGDGRLALRSYSTAWSLIGLLALVGLTTALTRKKTTGMLAGLLCAVHPLDIYFAQEARMYAQCAALFAVSSLCLWRWWGQEEGQGRRRGPWLAGYGVTALLMLFTHYLAVVLILAQALFMVASLFRLRRRRDLAYMAAVLTGVAVAFWPWLAYVYSLRPHLYTERNLGWIPVPPVSELMNLLLVELSSGPGRAAADGIAAGMTPTGPMLWQRFAWMGVLATAAALLVGALMGARRNGNHRRSVGSAAFCLTLIAGPVLMAFAATYVYHPVFFRPRFAILVLPPFLALLAIAGGLVRNAVVRRTLILAMVSLFSIAGVQQLLVQNKAGRNLDRFTAADVALIPASNLQARLHPLVLGSRIGFDADTALSFLGSGWHGREAGFRWSDGLESVFAFREQTASFSRITLSMFCLDRQRVRVLLNEAQIAAFECEQRAPHERAFAVQPEAVRKNNVLVFEHPDAVSPAALGKSGDSRLLALGIQWLEIGR